MTDAERELVRRAVVAEEALRHLLHLVTAELDPDPAPWRCYFALRDHAELAARLELELERKGK